MRLLPVIALMFLTITAASAEETTVDAAGMTEAVRQEFAEQGFGDNVEVEFFGGQTKFEFAPAGQVKILLSGLNAEDSKFTVDAEIFADGTPVGKTRLSGRYFVMVKIWVPAKDIERGKVITADDLQTADVRANRLREDNVTIYDELIGKQAVRQIKEGKPVSTRDIREEIVVYKGQTVMAVYEHKGLQITTKMEAQENGAKGQRIKLLNTRSGKEVFGKVMNKNTVEIAAE